MIIKEYKKSNLTKDDQNIINTLKSVIKPYFDSAKTWNIIQNYKSENYTFLYLSYDSIIIRRNSDQYNIAYIELY